MKKSPGGIRIRLLAIAASAFILATLPACEDVQIFKRKVAEDALEPVSDKDLKTDRYYVKNNTKFYEVLMPSGSAKGAPRALDESRSACVCRLENKIPPHYLNEVVAYTSNERQINEVVLERYRTLGYGIGVFGGVINSEGYLEFTKGSNSIAGSSARKAFEKTKSENIRIATIDGVPLSRENVNVATGCIYGLEKNKEYTIGYFSGTYYHEDDIIADTLVLQAFELYFYDRDSVEDTPNGYSCFNTPEDLESGYYNINGSGLFKYYSHKRGENDDVDMNISYYKTEIDKLAAYSRQYSVTVPQRVKDMKVTVRYNEGYTVDYSNEASGLYDTGAALADIIEGVAFSPDGKRYDMEVDTDKHEITLSMAEAVSGEWAINIVPKTLDIEGVEIENDKAEEEPVLQETDFHLPEGRENAVFSAEYSDKNENINGTIIAPDGRTYIMELWETEEETEEKKKHYFIGYKMPYAPEGDYKVRIYYHPYETTVEEPKVDDNKETDTDVIVVEG